MMNPEPKNNASNYPSSAHKLFKSNVLLFIFTFSLLFLSTVVFYVIESKKVSLSHEIIASDLFIENVQNEILNGDYLRVYKQCKSLIKNSNAIEININTSDNHSICNLPGEKKRGVFKNLFINTINKNIFFDDEHKDVAAFIRITYSREHLLNQILIWSALILASSCIFFIISFYLSIRLGKSLLKPIEIIANSLKHRGLGELTKIGDLDINHTSETYLLETKIVDMAVNLEAYHEKQIDFQKKITIAEIAKQVAHDIRSPLTSLEIVAKRSKNINKTESILIIKSVQKINEIAEDLLFHDRKFRHTNEDAELKILDECTTTSRSPLRALCLSDLLHEIIEQKTIEYSENKNIKITFNIEKDALSKKVNVNAISFTRAISNLINNAVEAIASKQPGLITVYLSKDDYQLVVEVRDNGFGISEVDLNRVINEGASIKKPNGNGLGIKYAKKVMKDLDGTLKISSDIGVGTTIKLTLPIAICKSHDLI